MGNGLSQNDEDEATEQEDANLGSIHNAYLSGDQLNTGGASTRKTLTWNTPPDLGSKPRAKCATGQPHVQKVPGQVPKWLDEGHDVVPAPGKHAESVAHSDAIDDTAPTEDEDAWQNDNSDSGAAKLDAGEPAAGSFLRLLIKSPIN